MHALQEIVGDASFPQDHKIHARQKPQLKNQKYCQRKYVSICCILMTMMIIGGVTLFSKYFSSPNIKTATTDDTIMTCACKDLVSGGYGNCRKKIDGKPLCYVELPSSCSDLKESASTAGEKWSLEACSQRVLGSLNLGNFVSCRNHEVKTCTECPLGHGVKWYVNFGTLGRI